MRNRLTEGLKVHLGWAVEGFRFSWGGAAVIPGGDALQDQGYNILRLVGMLQSPIDGVGQADSVRRGGIGFFGGGVMLR